MRRRVSSIYQMASRGGPAFGDTIIGWLAGLLGPVSALSVGALVPIGYAGLIFSRSRRIRVYRTVSDDAEDPATVTSA